MAKAKEPTYISGTELLAALDRVSKVMKAEVRRIPDLTYPVARGGLNAAASLAVVFTFDRKTLRHEKTTICSEKRAAKEWMKANGIEI